MDHNTLVIPSMVRLNIGGKKFCTTVDTLTNREPDSMLAAMFSGRYAIPVDSEEGYVFIDRDGKYFRHILNWLRDGFIPTLKEDYEYSELLREAEYFQLLGFIKEIKSALREKKYSRYDIIKSILSGKICFPGLNFSGLDLSKLNLSSADLSNAKLEGANLKYANLKKANLKGTRLTGACLAFVDLQIADLEHANLTDADMTKANLRGAKLKNANLSGADLRGANLNGADLKNTNVSGANLSGAKMPTLDDTSYLWTFIIFIVYFLLMTYVSVIYLLRR